MICNKYDDKLSFYVQNELSESEQYEIDEHLKSCYSCRIKVNELGTLLDGISKIEDVELPEDFHEKLLSRMEKELWTDNKKVFPYMRFVKYASAVAVFALCVFSVTHLSMFKSKKNDSALADNAITSSAASSSKSNEYGSKEVVPGVQYDLKIDPGTGTGSSSKDSTEMQSSIAKDTNGKSTVAQDKYSNNTAASDNNTAEADSGSAAASAFAGSTMDKDIKTDATVSQSPESKQADAKKSVLSSSQLLQVREQNINIQIKTNNLEAAFRLIDEQAVKVNTRAMHIAMTTGQTTQESAYSSMRSFSALQSAQTEDTVNVEVKKEYEERFKALLEQAFGKDNIFYEASEDISSDIDKFIIKITL